MCQTMPIVAQDVRNTGRCREKKLPHALGACHTARGYDMENSDLTPKFNDPTRILLVDADEQAHEAIADLIRGVGHRRYVLERVTSLVEGLWSLVFEDHDVYLVGHRLGDYTGIEFLGRAGDSRRNVPIIFLGDPDDYAMVSEAMDAGAIDFLVKGSIDSGLLNATIRNAMEVVDAGSRLQEVQHEELARSARSVMLTTVSHYLRAPTEAITETVDLALRGVPPREARARLNTIQRSASTLTTLANDLLDLSRIDAGVLQLEPMRFGLRDLVMHTASSLDPVARANHIAVRQDVASDVPDAVIGDPGRFRLALARLAELTMEHTTASQIAILVRTEMSSPGAVLLRVDVGPDEIIPWKEERYAEARRYESDNAILSRYDPGGLRLPVVSEIVSRMGGRLSVGSALQMGVVFRFTICLGISTAREAPRLIVPDEGLADLPVLVISDDLDTRRASVKQLARSALTPLAAQDTKRATELMDIANARGALPRAVVIHSVDDAFIEYERFIEAFRYQIPVVLVAPTGLRGDAARCRALGVMGYLTKPAALTDLADTVKATIALAGSGDRSTLVTRHWLRENRRGLEVLVADDAGISRAFLSSVLEDRGHLVTTVSSGHQALEAFKNSMFDVVLMDADMPEMNGLETARAIRSMERSVGPRVPIVAMTLMNQENRDRFLEAGIDDCLQKPIQVEALIATLEQERSPGILSRV